MGTVNFEYLKPGMVLENAVEANDTVLLPEGIELTQKHLDTLEKWGVLSADIEGMSNNDFQTEQLQGIDEEALNAFETKLGAYFSLNDMKHPFIAELFRISLMRRVRSSSKGK